ncbi:hypothetical protein L6452_38559 [Arctium lappa]|uniref:Uncharacterized protein n=1 Tax=Arctium lappa TaxID=4217 RepID=A0ACB8XPV7_ARCLA|nr:hypothetical protein L6452_38559 [Arctium lappa]
MNESPTRDLHLRQLLLLISKAHLHTDSVLELMDVKDLTLAHVKSHLQPDLLPVSCHRTSTAAVLRYRKGKHKFFGEGEEIVPLLASSKGFALGLLDGEERLFLAYKISFCFSPPLSLHTSLPNFLSLKTQFKT